MYRGNSIGVFWRKGGLGFRVLGGALRLGV